MSAVLKKVKTKLGGSFPDDFLVWLESDIWSGASNFEQQLSTDLGAQEINKIKFWDVSGFLIAF